MTGLQLRRIVAPILLLLFTLVLLAVVLGFEGAEAQTNPPSSGDWNIYDTTTISDQRVSLPAGLIVYSGGKLTLTNVDLVFTRSGLGASGIQVRGNAQFTFDEGTITHSSSSSTYRFKVDSGATVTMTNVTLEDLFQDPYSDVSNLDGGMVIRSHSVSLKGCNFTGMDRVAVTLVSANPSFENCTFEKTRYHTFYRSYNYLYREAYGIVAIDSSPKVEGCAFISIGDFTSAFNEAGSSSSSYCYLRLNGVAIYSIRGSPKVRDCLFEGIGMMPSSSYYYVYVPSVGRYVYFYFWSQDYRAAIMAYDPGLLEVSRCNFSYNFEGYYYYTSMAFGVYQNGGRSTIKNSVFQDVGGGGVYLREGTMILQNSEMHNFRYYGLSVEGRCTLTAMNLTMNGTAQKRNPTSESGLYIYRISGSVDIRDINITFCYRAIYVSDTTLAKLYDIYIANCTKRVYANAARVDCYNVSAKRSDIELGWTQAEVNIYWKLDVLVTWQNGVPIADSIVQIFNESGGLLKANQARYDGRMPTIILLQTKLTGTSNAQTAMVNSPLQISAYAAGIESDMYTVPFESNTFFQCIVEDRHPPNVEIYAPQRDHAQNHTTLRLFGIAVDVGSGLDGVEVSTDEGETWARAEGGLSWDLTLELEEGTYDLHVRGVDIAGAHSVYIIRNVTIDLTPPWLIITTPVKWKETIYTNQTTLTVIGQAEIGSKVFLNGEELRTQGGQFFDQLTDQQEGLNVFEVMAVDHVGNRNITLLHIYQDITPPILLIEDPPEEHVTNQRVLTIYGLTEPNVTVKIGDLPVGIENGLFTMPMTLQEGLNVITVQAVDLAQNYKVVTLRVTYDTKPPVVQMTYPTRNDAVNHSIITVAGKVEPDTKDVRVNMVPVIVRQNAFAKSFKLAEGQNLIVVKVTDLAGNTVTMVYSITLDTRAPDLMLFGPEDGAYSTTSSVTVSGRVDVGATITVDGLEVLITGGYFTYEAPLKETPPGGEPNDVVIIAEDEVGNQRVEVRRVYRDTIPPQVTVYEVSEVTRAEFINITGIVTNVDDLASMTINGAPVRPNHRGYFAAYVPLDIGTNVFILKAQDAAGNTVTHEVTVERAPRVVPDSGVLGLGDASWTVALLFLVMGVTVGLMVLYILERRRGVESA